MSSPLTLYTYWRSSCSWRVRICLALKALQFTPVPIHLVKNGGEQHSDMYKNLNPMAQVPTLIDGDFQLTQSMAIIEYLEERYPENHALFPGDAQAKARVRQVCEIINSGIQPVQNLNVLQRLDADKKVEWAHHYIARGFDALEQLLESTAGQYCVGDRVTAADACLVPQVMNAERFKVDMAKYPLISRINAELKLMDAFIVSDPSNQVDCPDKL